MPTKIIPLNAGSFEQRKDVMGQPIFVWVVRQQDEVAHQVAPHTRDQGLAKAKAQAAVEAQLISVPTQSDLDTALADLSQRLDARLTTVENMQANLASKHTEIISEIQKLPESVKIQLVKEAFGEWVTELVRAEVSKATSM